MMDIHEAHARLAASAGAIAALVADVGDDEARFHPRADAWSILEIVGHLTLEEIEDFRARFASTVRGPSAPWPPLDPEERVRQEAFDEHALGPLVASFSEARRESLRYLERLTATDLQASHPHPRGSLRAGDLLASWVAHDLLHVRQIVKNRYASWMERAEPYRVGYAGPW